MMTNEQALQKMKADIQLRGLATSTLNTYQSYTKTFLDYCNQPIEELNELEVRKFLEYLTVEKQLAPRTVNLYSGAIRFFFAVTLNRTMNYLQIPRQKIPMTIPDILSKDEVSLIINRCPNIKHQAFLLLLYGSGLRASETVNLHTIDIDSRSGRVIVRKGKGKKDRYTVLSENTLFTLRKYWRSYRPNSPEDYLFPGQKNVGHITKSAVTHALNEALARTNIKKNITPHTLRRSFAVHLLEDGFDLFQVKELLGHASIRSTVLYLRSANTPSKVKSPADSITIKFGGRTNE